MICYAEQNAFRKHKPLDETCNTLWFLWRSLQQSDYALPRGGNRLVTAAACGYLCSAYCTFDTLKRNAANTIGPSSPFSAET